MDIGIAVVGTKAMFLELLLNGPVIPGPLRKNPKVSLNIVPTYSGYSSEPKTKSKFKLNPVATKSNSKIDTFLIVWPES